MKIEFDKYYTNDEISKYIIDLFINNIGQNIDTIIEPFAGNGMISDSLLLNYNKNIIASDILPEKQYIIKKDYFDYADLINKDKIGILTNPPFGNNATLLNQIFNKLNKICHYAGLILPISWLNKNKYYNLLYSVDITPQLYSNKIIHCCFNIYDCNQKIIKSRNYMIPGIKIHHERYSKSINHNNFIFKIRRIGSKIGKLIEDNEKIKSYYIIELSFNNDLNKKIKKWFNEYNWLNIRNYVSFEYLNIEDIYKHLSLNFPELQNNNDFFNFN